MFSEFYGFERFENELPIVGFGNVAIDTLWVKVREMVNSC